MLSYCFFCNQLLNFVGGLWYLKWNFLRYSCLEYFCLSDTKTYSIGSAWTFQGFKASDQESYQLYHCRVRWEGTKSTCCECCFEKLIVSVVAKELLLLVCTIAGRSKSRQGVERRAKLWRSWIHVWGRRNIQLRCGVKASRNELRTKSVLHFLFPIQILFIFNLEVRNSIFLLFFAAWKYL